MTTHHDCPVRNSWFITEPLVPPPAPLFASCYLPGNSSFLWTSTRPPPSFDSYSQILESLSHSPHWYLFSSPFSPLLSPGTCFPWTPGGHRSEMEEDACFPEAHPSQWDGMWDGRSVDSKWQTQVIPRTAGSEEGPLQRASLRSRRTPCALGHVCICR